MPYERREQRGIPGEQPDGEAESQPRVKPKPGLIVPPPVNGIAASADVLREQLLTSQKLGRDRVRVNCSPWR